MADVLTYVGEASLTVLLPGIGGALFAAKASLEAQIAALVNFQATVSLSFAAQLAVLAQAQASLEAAIALGLQPPSLDVQIQITAAVALALQLQLQVILDLFNLLANAGVHAYAYDGRADGLGPQLTTALTTGLPGGAGAAEHTNALVLATTVGATWTAMQAIFKTTP